MKTKIFTVANLLFAFTLQANAAITQKKLACSGGKYEHFGATISLIDDHFAGMSDAGIQSGFVGAQLLCSGGNQLSDTACIGFWFNTSDNMVEAKFQEVDGAPVIIFQPIQEGSITLSGTWPCKIE